MEKITNNLLKELKKMKREGDLLFLDNIKIINDALKNKLIEPKYILVEKEELNIYPNCQVFKAERSVIEQLADTKTPQGVLCIADYLQHVVETPNDNFLVLDGLQDPGNVGTLIRTAFAAGFNDVFLIDSVRITNSKLVRSSVGAIFSTKVYEMTRKDFVEFATKNRLCLLKADMNGENIFEFADKPAQALGDSQHTNLKSNFSSVQPAQALGVVIGNEGQGVSKEIGDLCTISVKIPMQKGIESLNAAVSGGIIMYEINKKRLK